MTNPTKPSSVNPAVQATGYPPPGESEETHVPADEGLQALMADRHHRIQVAAYYRAERRGFAPGHELDDWLAAEDAIEAEDAARWAED